MNYEKDKLKKLSDKYNYPFVYAPFDHQDRALEKSWFKDNYALFMEMGCVDGETEYLTQTGWKKFADFDIESPEPIGQIRIETGELIFGMPKGFIKQPCEEFYHIHTEKTDRMLTGEHTNPCFQKSGGRYTQVRSDRSYKYAPTEKTMLELFNRAESKVWGLNEVLPLRSGRFNFKGYKKDALDLTDWELRLQVAVMADGNFRNKNDKKCIMNLRKKRKIERLRWLLKHAQVHFLEKKRKFNDVPYVEFTFYAPLKLKEYDERFWMIPLDQKKVIADECVRWDGSAPANDFEEPDKSITAAYFFTVKKTSADFIQFCFECLDYKTSIITKESDQYTEGMYYTIRVSLTSDNTDMNRVSNKRDGTKAITKVNIPGAFKYCFKTTTGYLLLRRDNKIFVTGNSGKTKVLIDTMGMLYRDKLIDSVVIIAPKGVYSNWVHTEIPAHLPPDIDINILHWTDNITSSKRRSQAFGFNAQVPSGKLDVFVINVESLLFKGGTMLEQFIKNRDKTLVIIDESTCIKNHEAKRTKKAVELGRLPSVKYKRIATGSPVTNSPLDLYAQCGFLDRSLLGFGSYYAFRGTYSILEPITLSSGQIIQKPVGVKNLELLTEKLDKFSFRVQKSECLDLPDKVYTTREVELTKEQKEIYNQMVKEAIAFFDENEMTANIAITKMMRLHQIVCGSFKDDEGTLHRIPNNRLETLMETLEETSGKVVIFANYRDNISQIVAALQETYGKESVVSYYGDTSLEDRQYAVQQFDRKFQGEKNPNLRFFVGNTQTAGYGITLTEATTVIYFSNDYSLERRLQSEDRCHRAGQINKVTYVDLVSRKTVDEKIIKTLLDKKNMADIILRDEKTEWLSLL